MNEKIKPLIVEINRLYKHPKRRVLNSYSINLILSKHNYKVQLILNITKKLSDPSTSPEY